MNACVSISYNADHRKADGSVVIPGYQHAIMLEETVKYLRREVDWPIYVVANHWPSKVFDDADEANVMNRIRASFHFDREDRGWQVGAATAIAMAVRIADTACAASDSLEYLRETEELTNRRAILDRPSATYLVHCQEDLIPRRGLLEQMVNALEMARADYIGEHWNPTRNEWCARFFGCRVSAFRDWQPDKVRGRSTELYMHEFLQDKKTIAIDRLYQHSHSYEEWRVFMEEAKRGMGAGDPKWEGLHDWRWREGK